MSVGAIVLALALWGGWGWWDAVDAAYGRRIYRPWQTSASVGMVAGGPTLTLRIDDPGWRGRNWSPLMPDHGKLMHMFLVKADDAAGFAHIHPLSAAADAFTVPIPPVPPGAYDIYADIVHESGFAHTLVDQVQVVATTAADPRALEVAPVPDPDDSWALLPPLGAARREIHQLPSGRSIRHVGDDVVEVDSEVLLRFSVTEADGTPSVLEPYMGMLGHAAVFRTDRSVFVHLHPSGSISMSAQRRFEEAEGEAAPSMDNEHGAHATTVATSTSQVAFPFLFPDGGPYRIVVQVKVDDVVETAAFDVDVTVGES